MRNISSGGNIRGRGFITSYQGKDVHIFFFGENDGLGTLQNINILQISARWGGSQNSTLHLATLLPQNQL